MAGAVPCAVLWGSATTPLDAVRLEVSRELWPSWEAWLSNVVPYFLPFRLPIKPLPGYIAKAIQLRVALGDNVIQFREAQLSR